MVIWGLISMQRAKKELRLEREEWENDNGADSVAHGKLHLEKPPPSANSGTPDLEAGQVELETANSAAPSAADSAHDHKKDGNGVNGVNGRAVNWHGVNGVNGVA